MPSNVALYIDDLLFLEIESRCGDKAKVFSAVQDHAQ